MKGTVRLALILAMGVCLSCPATAGIQTTLLDEDFESLTLGSFTSPTESGGDGTDFTNTPPSGWTQDNSGVVAGGPIEFKGFTFLDIDSWIATAGDQGRSNFASGGVGPRGTIMVADPDEYDDGINMGDTNGFNAYISTPSLNLSGAVDNTLMLAFDSSFRTSDEQIGVIEVSYDGNPYTHLLTVSSDDTNRPFLIDVGNIGASSAMFRFGLIKADNNWWWAIDNVKVTAEVTPVPIPGALVLGSLGLAFARWRLRK